MSVKLHDKQELFPAFFISSRKSNRRYQHTQVNQTEKCLILPRLIRQINVQFYLITYILSNLAQVNQISYLCVIKRMLNFLLICQNFLWTCIHHGIKCGKVTSGTYQNAVKRIELKKITHLLQHTLVSAFD